MKFRLYRSKHLRAEGNGLAQKLRNLLNMPKAWMAGVLLSSTIAAFNPAQAMAAENNMTDTSTSYTQEQVMDAEMTQADDSIVQAVEQAQAETPEAETPLQEQAVTPSINEEIDSRVPQVEEQNMETQTTVEETPEVTNEETNLEVTTDVETEEEVTNSNQQVDMGIVNENQGGLVQDTSNQIPEEKEDAEIATSETGINENTNADYHVIQQDGNLIIVGDISEDQLSQVIEDLTKQYGEDAVSGLTIFDYDTINSQMNYGETVQLGNSGYTAVKYEDGSIEVMDANGNVITSWQGQEINKDEETPSISDDVTIPEDYDHRDYEVNSDEYLIIKNADGSYTIAMGGVGLSNAQLQDLISKLQSEGVIPADAQVLPGVLPSAPTDEMKEQGKEEQLTQIGDYIISTKDGKTYTIYSEDGKVLETIIKYEDKQLEDNYETSKDPEAQPGNKAGHDEPGNEIPGDKPSQDPTPEPTIPDVTPGLPQMGDEASLAQVLAAGFGGASLVGAGLAGKKKRKNGIDGEELDGDSFEPDDELEALAQQWAKSEERDQWFYSKGHQEWLQQNNQSKGKTR